VSYSTALSRGRAFSSKNTALETAAATVAAADDPADTSIDTQLEAAVLWMGS